MEEPFVVPGHVGVAGDKRADVLVMAMPRQVPADPAVTLSYFDNDAGLKSVVKIF